jgi:hypothetical protein
VSTTFAVIVLILTRITGRKPPGYGVPGRTLTLEQREVLKKSLGILSEVPPRGMPGSSR